MFFRDTFQGKKVENTSPDEIEEWIKLLKKIKPSQVMIYTIERDTPVETLEKVSVDELHRIAELVKAERYDVQVSG